MSRKKGNIAEDKAVEYLLSHGFDIIERNFYSRFGEIDIIAFKDETFHFIEVKGGLWDIIYKIDKKKISKIVKTADIYMSKNRVESDFCFDAIIVTDKIEFIENITI